MSSLLLEDRKVLNGGSDARTWAGKLVRNTNQATTHYLHLLAFPCEKCDGPVVLGWLGTREDDISSETEVNGLGSICLCCGQRPKALLNPLAGRHFRPVEWQWKGNSHIDSAEASSEDPLSAELSQDSDSGTGTAKRMPGPK